MDLACLKLDVDRLYINKLETTPVDLSKLIHVIKRDVKKSAFDKFVKKSLCNWFKHKILKIKSWVWRCW